MHYSMLYRRTSGSRLHNVLMNLTFDPTYIPVEDLRSKLAELDALQENIRQQTTERGGRLQQALGVAERFSSDQQDAVRALRDIQDNIVSQDSPGVDPPTIKEQLRELDVSASSLCVSR